MSGEDVKQLFEPVIGFRTWVLSPEGRLGAINRKHKSAWPSGDLQARCMRQAEGFCEAPPGAECACGIYAWHSTARRDRFGRSDERIGGAILAWGAIEVAGTGFRAEWGRPVVLCSDSAWPARRLRAVELAARRHGAAMTTAEHLETLASEYGSCVPRDERPVDPLAEALSQMATGRPTTFTWDGATRLQRLLGSDRPEESALFADSIDLLLREVRSQWHEHSSLASLLQAGAIGLLHACRFHGRDPWTFRPVGLWWIKRAMRLLAAGSGEPFEHRVYRWSELHAEMQLVGPSEAELLALRAKAVTAEPEELQVTALEHQALLAEVMQSTGAHRAELVAHLYVWAKRSGVFEET